MSNRGEPVVVDKSGVMERLRRGQKLNIELGCGPNKVDPLAIGIDALDFPEVDLVANVFDALASFPDGSVNSVYSAHFFEHVGDLSGLLAEIARVAAPGAAVEIVVPHFSNPFYYSDPTHRTPFGLYTLAYLTRQSIFMRRVPQYGAPVALSLRGATLHFKSYPPRYIRHALKRLVGAVFNSSMYMREFYEENFCWLVPCYEVRYQLVRD
jgi:SAM-dependent methyltransferase